ncbi:MAG: cysteine--tRNA ligase [Candidatus Binataceae bacterium]
MKPFFIYNTLSRSVEEFKPLNPPVVTYYSCGPTVYLPQHLGNLRAYLCWDFLGRALELNGYRIRHVINVTDVGHMTSDEDAGEDKIERTARAEGKSPLEIANHYLTMFQRDLAALNVEAPEVWCRATDHIADMIALIERILAVGMAYVTPSGVYFDVEKYRGSNKIGRLSRQSLDEQNAEQRLEHSPDKKSPHDFALWVLNQPHHMMQWDSPWGRGYPGWHIECSAMSMRYLGETIDIHTGGMDLIPIHHENEIAQSESATGHPFVHCFVHNAFLVGKGGLKISKSSGKFPLLEELVKEGINPLAFRLFCFSSKYRSELALSEESIRSAEKTLYYFWGFTSTADGDSPDSAWTSDYLERFIQALNDDLNTPEALAVALELVGKAYRDGDHRIWNTLKTLDRVLGIRLEEQYTFLHSAKPPSDIQALIDERTAARQKKDFKRSDEIRQILGALGWKVKDHSNGTSLYEPFWN